MGEKVQLDKEHKAVLLFYKKTNTWEDRTMAIAAMYSSYYYGKLTGYDIYFKNAGKKLFFKDEKVRFLSRVCTINIEKQDVYVDGVLVTAFKVDQFEKGYYRIYVGNDIILSKNIELKSRKYKDIFTYFCKLADYAETIAEEQSPLYFIARNYKRISLPTSDSPSVLIDYLKGMCKPVADAGLMLLPFDFNQSQIKAIMLL